MLEFSRDAGGGFGEALRQPAFGGSVGGTGTDSDDRPAHAEFVKAGEAGGARLRCAIQTNAIVLGQGIENAGAMKKFQIVEALVARNFAPARHRDRAREQRDCGRRAHIRCVPGMPARYATAAASKAFCRRMAQSKFSRREGASGGPFFGETCGRCRESCGRKTARADRDRPPRASPESRFRPAESAGAARAARAGT